MPRGMLSPVLLGELREVNQTSGSSPSDKQDGEIGDMLFEQKDLFAKTRKDMEAEVKAGLIWVLLVAVLGLVLLTFYVMVVKAHAAPSNIAVRTLSIDNEVIFDRHNRFTSPRARIQAVNAIVSEGLNRDRIEPTRTAN